MAKTARTEISKETHDDIGNLITLFTMGNRSYRGKIHTHKGNQNKTN